MEIIKSTSSVPRKCEFGDFEIRPENGWKISQTFIDYESKLLVVRVSDTDQSNWIYNGYDGRTIPTKEYKVDLKTLSILDPEEWKKYFNYDKVEIISEDKKYKLVSQRIHEPERNTDGYSEELYDLSTGERISRSSSIAFMKERRENLLESFLRSAREKEEQKRILDEKPDLTQFYLKCLEELKDQDDILYYHDDLNVFRLSYADKEFILSGSGKLPVDPREWKSIKFDFIRRFAGIDEFWKEFSSRQKWYLDYSYLNAHGRISAKALVLAKHIISFFNELRRSQAFTYKEDARIYYWGTLVWSDAYKETEIKQWCSNCGKEVRYNARYPKYICSECFSKEKRDKKGNIVEFSNLGFSGGFRITYLDNNGKEISEDDTEEYCECIIDNKLFFAKEAKFGGIVIQAKE